jgi:hypothetical protein
MKSPPAVCFAFPFPILRASDWESSHNRRQRPHSRRAFGMDGYALLADYLVHFEILKPKAIHWLPWIFPYYFDKLGIFPFRTYNTCYTTKLAHYFTIFIFNIAKVIGHLRQCR